MAGSRSIMRAASSTCAALLAYWSASCSGSRKALLATSQDAVELKKQLKQGFRTRTDDVASDIWQIRV